jgi:hypothetical protein
MSQKVRCLAITDNNPNSIQVNCLVYESYDTEDPIKCETQEFFSD